MNVWTCTDHDGFWPVGVASVVVAETEREARAALDKALRARGLKDWKGYNYTLQRLDVGTVPVAAILNDGEY